MEKVRIPKFSGREYEWRDFAQEWRTWEALQRHVTPQIADGLLLQLLRESLDEASQLILQAERASNPELTFEGFWKKLERRFMGDVDLYNRRKWEACTLKGVGRLTPMVWRKFEAEFLLAKANIGGISDREAEVKLEDELSTPMRGELQREENRRKLTNFWVRISRMGDQSREEMARFVGGAIGRQGVRGQDCAGGWVFDCEGQHGRETVLELDGGRMGGDVLHITAYDKGMTLEEKLRWIQKQVEIMENEDRNYRTYSRQGAVEAGEENRPTERSRTPPSVKEGGEERTHEGKGKGKGGTQSWGNASGASKGGKGWQQSGNNGQWGGSQPGKAWNGNGKGKGTWDKGQGSKGQGSMKNASWGGEGWSTQGNSWGGGAQNSYGTVAPARPQIASYPAAIPPAPVHVMEAGKG